MRLHLVFIGKTNFPEIDAGLRRYLDRIRHYAPVEVHVVKAERIAPKASEEAVREREGGRVLKLFGEQGHLLVWDQSGMQMDSTEFAGFLQRLNREGVPDLWTVIGGPLGVSSSLREKAHSVLSLSRMTLPHDLARLVVLEQLYRAFTILRNEPYHK